MLAETVLKKIMSTPIHLRSAYIGQVMTEVVIMELEWHIDDLKTKALQPGGEFFGRMRRRLQRRVCQLTKEVTG